MIRSSQGTTRPIVIDGGEPLTPILADFDTIIEKTIVLGENVLVRLFYKLVGNSPLEILEIPLHERDPNNPRRLTVGILGT